MNSLVVALQRLQTNAFCEAPPTIQRRDHLGHWQYEINHPVLDLLYRPNEWWDGMMLFSAVLADLTFYGNAYVYIITNSSGRPLELVWLPAMTTRPTFLPNSEKFIENYRYQPSNSSEVYALAVKDVIHFRSEEIDPVNNRIGRSRLAALVPEIAVDREDTLYSAAIAHNMGAPSVIISPKDTENVDWDDATAESLERRFQSRTSGANRGKPLVLTEGVDVTPFSFKPSEMASDRAIRKVEARICQAYSVHPSVAASVLGVENSKMATLKQSYEMFWDQAILPLQSRVGSVLTKSLLARYETPTRNVRVGFDIREVRALLQDKLEQSTMVVEQYRWGLINRETAQLQLGYDLMDDGTFFTDTVSMLPSGGGVSDDGNNNLNDGQKPRSAARDPKKAGA